MSDGKDILSFNPNKKGVLFIVKKMNVLQKLTRIFIAPADVIHEIKEKPEFLLPFLYVFIIKAITGVLQRPMGELQQEEMVRLSIERYGVNLFSTSNAGISTNQSFWIGILLLPITLWIGWLIGSFFVWIISKIIKGKSTYQQVLSLLIHISMLTATVTLLVTPIDLLLQNSTTIFGLSILYPSGDMTSFIYNALNLMTLPSIWGAALTGIGLSIINEFSQKKGYIVAIILYIITILLGAGSVSMSFWILDIVTKQGLM